MEIGNWKDEKRINQLTNRNVAEKKLLVSSLFIAKLTVGVGVCVGTNIDGIVFLPFFLFFIFFRKHDW